MQPKTAVEAGGGNVRLPAGIELRPAVSAEELAADTEQDPQGAEDFVALIRAVRREFSRPLAL